MIIAGYPIATRELHHLAQGWLKLSLLNADRHARHARFNFLYFSYEPDFACLMLSMRSLRESIPSACLGQVVLAEDQKAPFRSAQIDQLKALVPQLHVMPVFDFEWGSPKSTHAELQIFKTICNGLPDPADLLVKVDSDVLFLRNAKWLQLLRSSAPAIGDGHYLRYRYAQGGLYMIRRQVVQDLLGPVSLAEVEAVAQAIQSVGEDMAISRLLADKGKPFFFTRMMLFPDEYGPLSRLNALVRREFLALHCHKDKRNMPALAQRFGLLGDADCPVSTQQRTA